MVAVPGAEMVFLERKSYAMASGTVFFSQYSFGTGMRITARLG